MSWFKKIETEVQALDHRVEHYVSGVVQDIKEDLEELLDRFGKNHHVAIEHAGHVDEDGTAHFSIAVDVKKSISDDAPAVPEGTPSTGDQPPPEESKS